MLAQELRIGNYINRLGKQTEIKAIQQSEKICYVNTSISGAITINQIEPIPLTEEWLLKLGFEVKDRKSNLDTDIFYMPAFEIDYCLFYADFRLDYGLYLEYTDSPFPEDDEKLYPITFGIKYVHQLQNLLYSLTGEELTIK